MYTKCLAKCPVHSAHKCWWLLLFMLFNTLSQSQFHMNWENPVPGSADKSESMYKTAKISWLCLCSIPPVSDISKQSWQARKIACQWPFTVSSAQVEKDNSGDIVHWILKFFKTKHNDLCFMLSLGRDAEETWDSNPKLAFRNSEFLLSQYLQCSRI